ncbi:hypothetical protein B7494_g1331 [Chlorociboria aeruginascens]|nr:hypothetical protein B7494_g1331 [Chlorociboria aeruginascens]
MSYTESDEAAITPVHHANRRWVIAIDGTWADRNSKGGPTVIADLARVLGKAHHNQFVEYLEGLGTSASIVENLHGGLTGLGIDGQILRAYSFLITNWSEGDEIVIAGYSRGAHAASILADLISCVGIPQENPTSSARKIYKRYKHGALSTISHCNRTSNEFECKAATVQALVLFDAVESLGIPKTGILAFLRWLSFSSKKKVADSIGPLRRVQNIFHALAIHEYREPYSPKIIYLPSANTSCNLVQVWFIGSHRDLGKEDRNRGGLVDTPLAWSIAKLRNIGVIFNEDRLRERFPSYINTTVTANIDWDADAREWARQSVYRTYKGLTKLMGYKSRTPGRYKLPSMRTNEFVHISVRDRGYGLSGEIGTILPGLKYGSSFQESGAWSSQGSWSSTESQSGTAEPQIMLREELLDPFEALLQGFLLPIPS